MRKIYGTLALVAFNLAVLLVGANLAVGLWLPSTPPPQRPQYAHAWLIDVYGFDRLARAYPGWARGELRRFLHETSNWITEFQPFTQFRMLPRHDRYITVSEHGFREGPQQAPWPPQASATNVFFFGGSMTLGAGQPDDQAIPALVQQLARSCTAPVAVYNFGRGFYFSTQERVLFDELLAAGTAPTLAVFIDGLNDFYYADGIPQWTPEIRQLMFQVDNAARLQHLGQVDTPADAAREFVDTWPLARLAARLSASSADSDAAFSDRTPIPPTPPAMVVPADTPPFLVPDAAASTAARSAIARLETNWRMIRERATAHSVRTAFVLQPLSTYRYDLRYLNVYEGKPALFGRNINSTAGYDALADRARAGSLGPDVLWLGDMQTDRKENLYVDSVHYTAAFSRDVAARLFDYLTTSGLLPCR
jgi:hypothetical protein